jgi:hypothetical protein
MNLSTLGNDVSNADLMPERHGSNASHEILDFFDAILQYILCERDIMQKNCGFMVFFFLVFFMRPLRISLTGDHLYISKLLVRLI